MKARLENRWKLLLLLPLMSACGFESCTADAIRQVADDLDAQADYVDGSDKDPDFGEWLADEIEDW